MVIEKSGFLYAYTSNEGTQDVFFDNVILGVNSGLLLELIKTHADKFADPNHVIDFVLNMASHQSDLLTESDEIDAYSIDHRWDILSGNDMKGLKAAFKTNTANGDVRYAHKNGSFVQELRTFLTAFQKSNGNNNLISEFVSAMRSYGIKVTVTTE